jgi:hypothetical protein
MATEFLNLYLSDLNAFARIDVSGNFVGNNYPGLQYTSATLYHGVYASVWKNIFKFYTTESCIDASGALLFTEQGEDIVGNVNATPTDYNVNDLYQLYNDVVAQPYEDNIVYANDIMYDISNNGCGIAANDFLRKLSNSVFGTEEASDLFSNQEEIENSYGGAVNDCSRQVAQQFDNKSTASYVSDVVLSDPNPSPANLRVATKIWNQLFFSKVTRKRFELAYNAFVEKYNNTDIQNKDDGHVNSPTNLYEENKNHYHRRNISQSSNDIGSAY